MNARRAIIVIDLGFGDAGKGTIVDLLARHTEHGATVVRFNGGPQAGHNVVLANGDHHTFSQFGSSTFVGQSRTLLSRFMAIEPYALLREAAHLESLGISDSLARLSIDQRCLVITPLHRLTNRLLERVRRSQAHGTCGVGFGAAVADDLTMPDASIRAVDFHHPDRLRTKLEAKLDLHVAMLDSMRSEMHADEIRLLEDESWIGGMVERCQRVAESSISLDEDSFSRAVRETDHLIFEAAQGVLLDEDAGFSPHTTWSRTTSANARVLLRECEAAHAVTCLGITRTYQTRHGAGPLPTERRELGPVLPEPHNVDTGPQGCFRRGFLDLPLMRYAIRVDGSVNALAVTHCDSIARLRGRLCRHYDEGPIPETLRGPALTQWIGSVRPPIESAGTGNDDDFLHQLSHEVDLPVVVTSRGPRADDKHWRIKSARSLRSSSA